MPSIRPAHPRDIDALHALLADHGLPVDDLRDGAVEFLVAVDQGRVVGVAGLEAHGDAGLLRSLAVRGAYRGTGLGRALARAIEAQGRERGLRELVLLTQTAEAFFAGDGYAVIDRAQAPVEVRQSTEFRALCPASATCMRKPL